MARSKRFAAGKTLMSGRIHSARTGEREGPLHGASRVGTGIEKKQEDFAADLAKRLGSN